MTTMPYVQKAVPNRSIKLPLSILLSALPILVWYMVAMHHRLLPKKYRLRNVSVRLREVFKPNNSEAMLLSMKVTMTSD